MRYPQIQSKYTLREILNDLEMRDGPSLSFFVKGLKYEDYIPEYVGRHSIQTSHLLNEQLLALEGWADSKWRYLGETNEWVPIFVAVDDSAVEALCDIEPDTHFMYEGHMWCIPRGIKREQYVPYDEQVHGVLIKV